MTKPLQAHAFLEVGRSPTGLFHVVPVAKDSGVFQHLLMVSRDSARHDLDMGDDTKTENSKAERWLADQLADHQITSKELHAEVLHMLIARFVEAHPEFETNQKRAVGAAMAHYAFRTAPSGPRSAASAALLRRKRAAALLQRNEVSLQ